jgi:hypothetical protein
MSMLNIFINSPLENRGYNLNNYFIEMLTNNLMLHFIMLYLIFMLIMMVISRLIIDSNINLDKIKNLPLPLKVSLFLHSIVVKLVNVWRFSVNGWLLFGLSMLFFFTCGSAYSFYVALSLLK